ncbi:MAG: hypothetical protein AB7S75_19160 [Desulfococcaceae bacterium]
MKRFVIIAFAILMTATMAWGQDDFKESAEKCFSVSILKSVKFKNGKGTILFNASDAEYFTTGDKINKIFAIESARLFRDVDDLTVLEMTIPLKEGTRKMSIMREQIEVFYKVKFAPMKGDLNAWRMQFLKPYDNKQARADFCKKFVTSPKK